MSSFGASKPSLPPEREKFDQLTYLISFWRAFWRVGFALGRIVFKIQSLMAETKGFEPSIPFPVYSLSRGAPSTTRPRLRGPVYWAKSEDTRAKSQEIQIFLEGEAVPVSRWITPQSNWSPSRLLRFFWVTGLSMANRLSGRRRFFAFMVHQALGFASNAVAVV